ncbi:MAG TPA: hypothetical protein VHF50_04280 [Solirubrobacterales bacterium]|nr:hypothetical protein [Solirubrobacterales bacterium]
MNRLTIYYGLIWQEQGSLLSEYPLRDAVERAESVNRYNHDWLIGNLSVDEGRQLLVGKLGYPETEQRTQEDYDPVDQAFVEQTVEVPDAASAAFALNYASGALAFEGTDRIGPTGFVNHFVALLRTVDEGFKGQLVRIATEYREFLAAVDKVTRVSFEVVPTNPRDRNIFRPLDEGMKAANASRERVTLENDEGLVVPPPESRDETTDNPAIMGIEMNEEGYGNGFKIDAKRQGRDYRFDSEHGGGLLRDVVEDAPEDADYRTSALVEHLEEKRLDEEGIGDRESETDEVEREDEPPAAAALGEG